MRKQLLSLLSIGIVVMMAGAGALAVFSDTEKSEGNTFTAGELDLKIDWTETYNGEEIESQDYTDNPGPIFWLSDVKPGDEGEATISVHVFNNDAWVCVDIDQILNDDVSSNEPELLVDDEEDPADNWDGELAQNIDVVIWQETDGNNVFEDGERLIYDGKACCMPEGFEVDGDLDNEGIQELIACENYYIGLSWEVPFEVGNEIQSDMFRFDMTFNAYQRRHQDENPCLPSCEDLETLYLADCGDPSADGNGTILFDVNLDDSDNRAYLNQLTVLSADYWDQVAAIAASADGENIYVIDKSSKHLGIYNVVSDNFEDRGVVSGLPGGVVLAAFSPDGELVVASDDTNELYTVDITTPSVTSLGTITKEAGGTLDIMGADLVFCADGVLYVWVNSSPDPGLFKIDNLDNMVATFQGTPDIEHYFTGLAIRAAGTGCLVGSSNSGSIWEVDPSDASSGTAFEPWLGDEPYDVGYGDMTVGILCVWNGAPVNGDEYY